MYSSVNAFKNSSFDHENSKNSIRRVYLPGENIVQEDEEEKYDLRNFLYDKIKKNLL